METLILIIHITLSLLLIALVLLQQGKGADAGAAFGAGASQTMFGGRGSTSFLVKLTSIVSLALLITCIALYVLTKQKVNYVTEDLELLNTQEIPAALDVPKAEAESIKSKNNTAPDHATLKSDKINNVAEKKPKLVDTKIKDTTTTK